MWDYSDTLTYFTLKNDITEVVYIAVDLPLAANYYAAIV